jgi:hypothetical protein
MIIASTNFCSDFIPYSNHSTYATYYERQEIKQSMENEWYRAAAIRASYTSPPTIMHMHLEPLLSDYQCPDPIRSYKIKVRVVSKVKGESVSYNEPFKDML